MSSQYVDVKETQEKLDILSSHFGIPNIKFKHHKVSLNRGIHYGTRNEIHISAWINYAPPDDIIIHEFAHALCGFRYGRLIHVSKTFNRYSNRSPIRRIIHGKEFMECLLEVIKVYYGDIHRYRWGFEYASIRNWYNRNYSYLWRQV